MHNSAERAKEILTPMAQADERECAYADSVLTAIALAETEVDLKEIEQNLSAVENTSPLSEEELAKKYQGEIILPLLQRRFRAFQAGRYQREQDTLS